VTYGRPRSARLSRRIGFWIIGPLAAAVLAIYAGGKLPTALDVAHGHGIHGSFTAEQFTEHHHSESWTGTFTPADHGQVIKNVRYNGDLPGASRGTQVAALYVNGGAYAPNGSREWMLDLVLLIAGLLVFGVWCLRVPLGYLRRHSSVPPPPWVRTA
jgi:hypothetical protein